MGISLVIENCCIHVAIHEQSLAPNVKDHDDLTQGIAMSSTYIWQIRQLLMYSHNYKIIVLVLRAWRR